MGSVLAGSASTEEAMDKVLASNHITEAIVPALATVDVALSTQGSSLRRAGRGRDGVGGVYGDAETGGGGQRREEVG